MSGVIDGMTNGVGVISFIVGEGIKYIGGGRISSYPLITGRFDPLEQLDEFSRSF